METITLWTIIICALHLVCLITKQVIWHVSGKWYSALYGAEKVIDACAGILLSVLCIASWVIEAHYAINGLDIAPIRIMCIYMIVVGVLFLDLDVEESRGDHYHLPGVGFLSFNAAFAITAMIF